MGYIYKVTNTLNGKVYIGQTRREVSIRWNEHQKYAWTQTKKCCSALYAAIRKYGDGAFTIETIEECDSERINERERYWIKFYDSTKHGYNLTLGGDGGCKVDDADIRRLWDAGYCGKEIYEMLGVCHETVYRRLKGIGITKRELIDRGKQKAAEKKTTPIYQYDVDGNYIGKFESVKEASKAMGGIVVHTTPTTHALLCGGYQWKRYKADKVEPVEITPRMCSKGERKSTRRVVQLSRDGEYMNTYDSITEAANAVKGNPTGITSVCGGRRKTNAGFRWMYYEQYFPNGA